MSAAERDVLATADNDVIREAQARLRLATDSESENRQQAITALEFRNGQQWLQDIRRERETDARPCLTINLTDAVIRRVENACRENRPRIKIDPVGDGADVQTAKVLNGLTRHVEAISGADYAYDCAQSSAITSGWGWLSVRNDFPDDKSFDQELFIDSHRNPFKIYGDPASRLPDGSDMMWLIESEMIPRTEYKLRYGALDEGGWQFFGQGDKVTDWSTKEQIRVAKYWRVEEVNDTLVRLKDGRIAFKSMVAEQFGELLPEVIAQSRPTLRRIVRCYLLSGRKVLKSWDWPGRWIPYVPVYGREVDVNGRITRKGMTKDLMDPARMYNYAQTSETEVYALQPKAPWLMPEGSMEGHESAWRDANRKPIVGLEYKQMYAADGLTLLPPPIRQAPPPVAAGFTEWSQSSQSNFMAVAGMPHDPNQDAKGEVVSGIAIRRRQGLSDISHFDFYDNFCRSLRQLGRILVDLYPHFYTGQRMQRIIREDGTSEVVTLNERKLDEQGIQTIKNGTQTGRYDVVVDTGPAYQTKREESAEAKLELLATPLGEMVGKSAGDLIVRGMDFENSDEIADRLQAMIPGATPQQDLKDLPPKAQTMISGLQAQLAQANQKSMALELELKAKHGLEQMRQEGENKRLHFKEGAETERTRMELQTKRDDMQVKAHTSLHDTHVKAVTAHDVAEIKEVGTALRSHVDHAHERALADQAADQAEKAGKREP